MIGAALAGNEVFVVGAGKQRRASRGRHSAVGCWTVLPTHRLSPQEAEVQDTLPSSVCLALLNSAVPLRVPQKSTAEGRTTLGYFSQAGNILLKFG